jgi:hypothetical protein
MVVVSGASAQDTYCLATPAGADTVYLRELPEPASIFVNRLVLRQFEPVDDGVGGEVPSELEPEGAGGWWLHIKPVDGSEAGWVYVSEVALYGEDCQQYLP